jgi:transposase-like protein
MLDWHRANGHNISRTARHFGYSRPTVYRWLGRFDRHRLESLEDRSSAPRRRRRPTWSVEQLQAVREIRERYPRSGQGQARRPAAPRRDPAIGLDGGPDPAPPPTVG